MDDGKSLARMKCETAVAMVLEFLEGSLSPEMRHSLEEHLAKCPPCQHLVATYERTTHLCQRAMSREPPPNFGDRLLRFLREQTLPNKRR